LESSQLPPGIRPKQPDTATALAIRAWNWMGGQIDWAGLPMIAELLGLDDMELLINQLSALRDWQHGNQ
jgi:hypothetical protein